MWQIVQTVTHKETCDTLLYKTWRLIVKWSEESLKEQAAPVFQLQTAYVMTCVL